MAGLAIICSVTGWSSQHQPAPSRARLSDSARRIPCSLVLLTPEVVALLQHFSALANDEWWEAGDVSRAVPFQAKLREVQAQLLRLSAKLLGRLSTERMDLRDRRVSEFRWKLRAVSPRGPSRGRSRR